MLPGWDLKESKKEEKEDIKCISLSNLQFSKLNQSHRNTPHLVYFSSMGKFHRLFFNLEFLKMYFGMISKQCQFWVLMSFQKQGLMMPNFRTFLLITVSETRTSLELSGLTGMPLLLSLSHFSGLHLLQTLTHPKGTDNSCHWPSSWGLKLEKNLHLQSFHTRYITSC